MLVGEQPGDQEDLAGRRSRRQTARRGARSRARAWRATVYVTNAVKHFKCKPRGKRRPSAKWKPAPTGLTRNSTRFVPTSSSPRAAPPQGRHARCARDPARREGEAHPPPGTLDRGDLPSLLRAARAWRGGAARRARGDGGGGAHRVGLAYFGAAGAFWLNERISATMKSSSSLKAFTPMRSSRPCARAASRSSNMPSTPSVGMPAERV